MKKKIPQWQNDPRILFPPTLILLGASLVIIDLLFFAKGSIDLYHALYAAAVPLSMIAKGAISIFQDRDIFKPLVTHQRQQDTAGETKQDTAQHAGPAPD